jgi:hypothetical protein
MEKPDTANKKIQYGICSLNDVQLRLGAHTKNLYNLLFFHNIPHAVYIKAYVNHYLAPPNAMYRQSVNLC